MFRDSYFSGNARPEQNTPLKAETEPTQDWASLTLADLIGKYYHGSWDGISMLTSHRDYVLAQKEIIENMAAELEREKHFEHDTAEAMAAQLYIQHFAKAFKSFDAYSN